MNRNSLPIIILLAIFGLGILGIVGVFGVVGLFVLPRILHSKSALDEPANPNMSVDDFNRRGNQLYEQRLYKRAAIEYGHMIEKAPKYAFGYQLRAMAEQEEGDYKRAVRDNTEGLKYETRSVLRENLYFNRGLAYRSMRDYKHAVPDLGQAIALKSTNWPAYEVRAFCYMALGNYNRAIADYTIAIAHDPHPGTVFERGEAYLAQKDYRQALADLNRSIADRPSFVPAYPLRANIYVGLKEYDRAVADAETALRMDGSAGNRGNLGWFQYLAGKLPEAIANSQEAIKKDPRATFARFNLGLCYAVQGNADAAQTAYRDALQHAKVADIKGGLQDVKDALAKQPNSAPLKQAETLLQGALPHGAVTP